MPSAIETFRAQREAAEGIHGSLQEVSELLKHLRQEADAIARNDELRAVLQREESWLEQAERAVAEVREWREAEALRFWPGVARRWAVALILALMSAWTAGAGYAFVTKPWEAELTALRSRAGFAELVEHRVAKLTRTERRQFDALMKWGPSFRRISPCSIVAKRGFTRDSFGKPAPCQSVIRTSPIAPAGRRM
jgi:hypothetical protein